MVPPDPPGHKRLGSLGHDLGGTQRAGIGSNLVYAAIHQFGGAGRGHQVEIPARRYLPFDENGQLAAGARQSILEVVLTALSRNR
ncbi:phage virion morphogenesis protein [Pseudomonas aeruginosa]|uniref:phage virion morphogenesis protein n=1 Tax=Pseudomonas aeruginosa TaxID=287 RepID=UPI001F2E6BFE|nr:phage virion morphogenesis protein [Pseudomonas aeruginosa]